MQNLKNTFRDRDQMEYVLLLLLLVVRIERRSYFRYFKSEIFLKVGPSPAKKGMGERGGGGEAYKQFIKTLGREQIPVVAEKPMLYI